MPLNSNTLLRLCNLFNKKASLEEDMAKRIMLSIIPAVMDPTQRISGLVDPEFWGLDYKALRSASRGAKDLIKYGAMVCVDELKYYGAPVKNLLTDTLFEEKRVALEKILDNTFNLYIKAKNYLLRENYEECLRICVECFEDYKTKIINIQQNPNEKSLRVERRARTIEVPVKMSLWYDSYGGEAWTRIAKTLYKITRAWNELQLLREVQSSGNTKRKKEYVSTLPKSGDMPDFGRREVQLMKEIVVLMNVFDGLAHNTGNIMPKLIKKEIHLTGLGGLPEDEQKRYKQQILRLMDSKELDNPFEVFKEIQYIMNSSPYREMFSDWIGKILHHPEYHNLPSHESREERIQKIRAKKLLMEDFETIILANNNTLTHFFDNYINAVKEGNVDAIRVSMAMLYSRSSSVISDISVYYTQLNRSREKLDSKTFENIRNSIAKYEDAVTTLCRTTDMYRSNIGTNPQLYAAYLVTIKQHHEPKLQSLMEKVSEQLANIRHNIGAIKI